jgi:hypothetical protein
MDNPKRWLVGKHNILTYDNTSQAFYLNFDLADRGAVDEAIALCEAKIRDWIRKEIDRGKLDDAEILRLYRVLDLARQGEDYEIPAVDGDLKEFALLTAVQNLHQRYPHAPIAQQPYDTRGYAVLVGTASQPVAYVNVKATRKLSPCFWLSEGERQFSLEHSLHFLLMNIYAINLESKRYRVAYHQGAIQPQNCVLVPAYWKVALPDTG